MGRGVRIVKGRINPGRAGCFKALSVLMLFILAYPLCTLAGASVAGVYVCPDDTLLMYVRGMEGEFLNNGKDASAVIGSLPCEVTGGSVGSEESIHFRTVILIDNSLSINSTNRERMKELSQRIIHNHADREEFILCTFSTELHSIAAGTDYAALSAAAAQIQFNDQDAYLVDCMVSVLEQLGQSEDNSFNRVILMSDGVDDNKGGKTYVDLMAMLKEDRYRCPIYTVTSVWEKNTSGLKNLQALSREVNSETFVLDETEDLSLITTAISGDYSAKWFRIHVPPAAEDGTVRTVSLSVTTTQDQYDYTCQVKMPEPAKEEPAETEKMMMTEEPTEEPTEKIVEPTGSVSGPSSRGKYFIIGGAILLTGMIILAVVITLRKKQSDIRGDKDSRFTRHRMSGPDSTDRTVTNEPLLKGMGPSAGRAGGTDRELTQDEYGDPLLKGQTVGMWDNTMVSGSGRKIILTDIRDAHKRYEAVVKVEIMIGRDMLCSIVISEDKTVSAFHCRLFMRGTDVLVEDLHSYNGTSINGRLITRPEVLHDGDELKLGAARLKVSMK